MPGSATRPASPTAHPPAPPLIRADLIAALREDLLSAGYTSPVLEDLLGPMASAALRREQALPALRVLARSPEPGAALLALFGLGRTLPRDAVDAALPRLGADGACDLGLVELTGADGSEQEAPEQEVRALVDLAPYSAEDDLGEITWWIASDLSELATGAPLSPDHVLGVGGASLTLARITPRDRVGRALDMGCGCGIQAMHAARHADEVVATDLSPRALAFASFNAALNGIELDLRAGSLFDPVAGEAFDLIVSNPPFVITPRGGAVEEWTYRDGGEHGDALCARVVAGLPGHLAPGGRAVMLANWEIVEGRAWDEHPRAWFDATGLDAWVIQREREDPAQYAETWARDGGIVERDERWAPMLTAWLDDFAARDVEGIGFGYVLAHAPADGPRRAAAREFEEVPTTGSGSLGAHLGAGLGTLGRLASLDDSALGGLRLRRADDVVERRHLTPGAWDPMLIELVQGAGFGRSIRADQLLAATVGACDGDLTLDQIVGAVCALTDADPAEARGAVLPSVREMVRTGMLLLPPDPPSDTEDRAA
ncbi:DUF7059 domain-containing protein [Brachybacterium huguangmaarense]